jgi:hypothetical protein
MASREQRSNKEKKKPKADWNQNKKGGLPPHLQRAQLSGGTPVVNIGNQQNQNPKK